jgi:hypothetical protein
LNTSSQSQHHTTRNRKNAIEAHCIITKKKLKRRRRRRHSRSAALALYRWPAAAPVVVRVVFHPYILLSAYYRWLRGSYVLALLICFAAHVHSLPTTLAEDGVELRREGTVSAAGAAACLGGAVGFGPPGEMRRIM